MAKSTLDQLRAQQEEATRALAEEEHKLAADAFVKVLKDLLKLKPLEVYSVISAALNRTSKARRNRGELTAADLQEAIEAVQAGAGDGTTDDQPATE